MDNVIKLYKKIAETPLEALQRLRKLKQIPKEVPMAYAGRLDPAAHGLLLVLVGDECKNRDFYQNLDKEYVVEVILGVSTDTFDLLGVITDVQESVSDIILNKFLNIMTDWDKVYNQSYPPYSSYHVKGKPLFWWAREKRLDEIQIPSKEVTINSFEIVNKSKILRQDLLTLQSHITSSVNGDFRQKEINRSWREKQDQLPEQLIQIKLKLSVKSGFYVRQFIKDVASASKIPAVVKDIYRTQVGPYELESL
ncbi:hypothetical protein KC669_02070 [Candidatus Dojkabacteria bacterium]|uniref:tRNA pseudouridine(55) synthase n=1 Tax=Candidatus Dojkabacteria bacterium TaxID=2099670 RepID=A0A955RL86_9BACT|nr:hypothetical protein [Candidatus Dojkabacteria bacterium]